MYGSGNLYKSLPSLPQRRSSVLWPLAELNFHVVHNISCRQWRVTSNEKKDLWTETVQLTWAKPNKSRMTTYNNLDSVVWHHVLCIQYRKAAKVAGGRGWWYRWTSCAGKIQMKVEILLRKGSTQPPYCFGLQWIAMDSPRHRPFRSWWGWAVKMTSVQGKTVRSDVCNC